MKIVINTCYGGFSVSDEFAEDWNYAHGTDLRQYEFSQKRTDPDFVQMVEDWGSDAYGRCAKLSVVEIPDESTDWTINDYDGAEAVLYVLDGKIHYA